MMRGNFKLRHYPKTVLTPLKWDVCITPKADIGQLRCRLRYHHLLRRSEAH
jgi:hypothetical protein